MGAIAKLMAVVGLDASGFKAGAKDATGAAKGFQGQIDGIGKAVASAFAVGSVVAFGRKVMDWAAGIKDAADSVGLLYGEMDQLSEIANDSGVEVDQVAKLIAKIETEAFAAANGTKALSDGYDNLGIKITDLFTGDMDPVKRLQLVGKAALESANPTGALAGVFGEKLGPKAKQALADIVAGYDAVKSANGGFIEGVDDAQDKIENMWNSFKRGAASAAYMTVAGLNDLFGGSMVEDSVQSDMQRAEERKRNEIAMAKQVYQGQLDAIMKRQAAEQDAADKITDQTEAERRARLQGLDKIKADYEANLAEMYRIRETASDAEKRAIDERIYFLERSYQQDVDAFNKAEKEKTDLAKAETAKRAQEEADRASGQRNKEMDDLNEKWTALEAKSVSEQLSATGRGADADSMAQLGGFRGGERPMLAATDKLVKQQEIANRYQKEISEVVKTIEAKIGTGGASYAEG